MNGYEWSFTDVIYPICLVPSMWFLWFLILKEDHKPPPRPPTVQDPRHEARMRGELNWSSLTNEEIEGMIEFVKTYLPEPVW